MPLSLPSFNPIDYHFDLAQALLESPFEKNTHGIFFVYQAKVSLQTGGIVGHEALLRWHHTRGRVIAPEICLEMAENAQLTRFLHVWTVHKVCADMHLYPQLNAAVNMCPTLLDQATAEEILTILAENNVLPTRLTVELTEYYPPKNMKALGRVVNFLREKGVKVALDDFGTGHATMNYLVHIELDEVKIDTSLVSGMADSVSMRAELVAMLDLISVSGAKVTCEGVETKDEANILHNMGVDQGQGYFFAKPMLIHEIFSKDIVSSLHVAG